MYSLYQSEILKVAQRTRLNHHSEMHGQSSNGEALCTDYFYTAEKKSHCLVHLSGVHGVEGYLGSLIQRELLNWKWASQHSSELPFQVVVVHAVNPWGMANFQRGNSKNVDLNRNSLKDFHLPNTDFKLFEPFLRQAKPSQLIKLLPVIFKIGYQETVKAVACGQTDFAKSLFYAGDKLQPEIQSLKENLESFIAPNAEVYFLDVHTGLGKNKKESLILDGFETSSVTAKEPEESFFQNIFQSALVRPGRDFGFYRANGPLSLSMRSIWGQDKVRYIFQEFGTHSFYKVLNALISRNPREMQEAFFPEDSDWRQHCVKLGLLRFMQMMENLETK